MEYSQIFLTILKVSMTTAAMCIPSISVAYTILHLVDGEEKRMATVIGYGTAAAIVLITGAITTLFIVCLEYEQYLSSLILSGGFFVVGCLVLIYIMLILCGFKREPIIPKKRSRQDG